MEIKISDLWLAFKRAWIVMLICAVFAGGFSYFYTQKTVQKTYTTSVSMLMTYQGGDDMVMDEYSKSVAVANAIAPTILALLNNEMVAGELLQRSAGRLDYDYSVAQMSSMINAGYDPATEAANYRLCLQIRIKAFSAEDCGVLITCLRDNINDILKDHLAGGMYELQPYSYVYNRGIQVASNAVSTALLWTGIGLVLPYVAVLIYTLVDRRVYSEEDLKRACGKLQILGQIPSMD